MLLQRLSPEPCKCGKPASEDDHSCPYQSEIYDNADEHYCNCCYECSRLCAEDV